MVVARPHLSYDEIVFSGNLITQRVVRSLKNFLNPLSIILFAVPLLLINIDGLVLYLPWPCCQNSC